nr:zinc finger, CCHC-type, retrotransposon Gag domain protein [Tanacetum cinerariifolium]
MGNTCDGWERLARNDVESYSGTGIVSPSGGKGFGDWQEHPLKRVVNALLPGLTAQITNELCQNGAGSNGDQPPTIHTWLERFGKQKPRSFCSATSPVDAENWIAYIEKLFEVLGCADEFKVRLASYKFEGDALNWWKLSSKPREQKYERLYHTIHQKDSELTGEFMKRFLRLAGFVEKKAANAGRNVKLLRERGGIKNKRNRDGDRIQSVNKNNNQRGYGQRGNDGRNYDRQGGNSSQRFYQQNQDQQYNRSSGSSRQKKYTDYTSPPPCDTCGKPHPGKECYRATDACFSYGLTGHMAKDYGPSLETHSIVWDFSDVFPKELPGIPPEHKVEFGLVAFLGHIVSADGITMDPAKLVLVAFLGHIVSADGITMDPAKYHPGKDNVVADALSRKSGMLANLQIEPEIIKDLERMDIELCIRGTKGYWANLKIKPNLILWIKEAHKEDAELWAVFQKSEEDEQTKFQAMLSEAYSSPFFIHSGSTKMYEDLKQHFWWNGIKQDIATYVGRCLICQQVKIEHQRTGDWDQYLCLVEFAYNNSWHASIKAAPYELLYGQKYRAPVCWNEVGERVIEGPELIEVTIEKVNVTKEKLKEARSRQKSYVDHHRRSLELNTRDRVFLKVSSCRGVRRFRIKGKLSLRFKGPFEILDRVGEVSYRLALPPQLSHVHNMFHVSLLRGYKYHPLHVVSAKICLWPKSPRKF